MLAPAAMLDPELESLSDSDSNADMEYHDPNLDAPKSYDDEEFVMDEPPPPPKAAPPAVAATPAPKNDFGSSTFGTSTFGSTTLTGSSKGAPPPLPSKSAKPALSRQDTNPEPAKPAPAPAPVIVARVEPKPNPVPAPSPKAVPANPFPQQPQAKPQPAPAPADFLADDDIPLEQLELEMAAFPEMSEDASSASSSKPHRPLLPGWTEEFDEVYKVPFFFNHETGDSTWIREEAEDKSVLVMQPITQPRPAAKPVAIPEPVKEPVKGPSPSVGVAPLNKSASVKEPAREPVKESRPNVADSPMEKTFPNATTAATAKPAATPAPAPAAGMTVTFSGEDDGNNRGSASRPPARTLPGKPANQAPAQPKVTPVPTTSSVGAEGPALVKATSVSERRPSGADRLGAGAEFA